MNRREELKVIWRQATSRIRDLREQMGEMSPKERELRTVHDRRLKELNTQERACGKLKSRVTALKRELQQREETPDAEARVTKGIIGIAVFAFGSFALLGLLFGPIWAFGITSTLLIIAFIGNVLRQHTPTAKLVSEVAGVEAEISTRETTLDQLRTEFEPIQRRLMLFEARMAKLKSELDRSRWKSDEARGEIDAIERGIQWTVASMESGPKLNTVSVSRIGLGREWIYAYTFPSAVREGEPFPIKVGMTTQSDPLERINQQLGTSAFERATVLLLVRCNNSGPFERWLHEQLQPSEDRVGKEWFDTTPRQLKSLVTRYVEGKVSRAVTR